MILDLDKRVGKGRKSESGFVCQRSKGCKQPELTAYSCKQGDGHRKESQAMDGSYPELFNRIRDFSGSLAKQHIGNDRVHR